MTKKCCIPNCERWNCDPKNFYLSYFRIPLDLERRQKWLDKINAQFNTNIEPKACSNYVCSLHFVRESLQFGPTGKLLRVKKDALPSVFVDSKEYIVPRYFIFPLKLYYLLLASHLRKNRLQHGGSNDTVYTGRVLVKSIF